MSHRIPTTAVVEIGLDLVVLDTHLGEYACVPQWRSQALDPDWLKAVTGAGHPSDLPSAPLITAPSADLEEAVAPVPTPAQMEAFMVEAAALYAVFRFRSFERLLSKAALRDPRLRRPAEEVAAAALACRRLMPWAPRAGQCLYRSKLLLNVLHRLGLDADWVLGVRTWPFEAHCWLQLGDVVLDDRADRAAAFTPILVV